jgi:hypothetical protein
MSRTYLPIGNLELQELFAESISEEVLELNPADFINFDSFTPAGWATNYGCTANALAIKNGWDNCEKIQDEYRKMDRLGDHYGGALVVIDPAVVEKNRKYIGDCKKLTLKITDDLYECVRKELSLRDFAKRRGMTTVEVHEFLYPCKCRVMEVFGIRCSTKGYKIRTGYKPPKPNPLIDIEGPKPGHSGGWPLRCPCKVGCTVILTIAVLRFGRSTPFHDVAARITKCGPPMVLECTEHVYQGAGAMPAFGVLPARPGESYTYSITVQSNGNISDISFPPNSPVSPTSQRRTKDLFTVGKAHIAASLCTLDC